MEMVRSRVEFNAALKFCIVEVKLIIMVEFRGPILEVDCRGHT